MNRAAAVTVFIILGTSSHAAAQEKPADLAKKLGSSTFQERESAAKKLEKLGPAALPALRASYASADLETRRRAVAVMERIEEHLLREEITRATPTRIRIEEMRLEKTLRLIEKQTGLQLGGVDPDPPLTIDTGELPFWQAWRAYCKAAKLHEVDPTRWSAKLRAVDANQLAELLQLFRKGMLHERASVEMPRIEFTDKPDGAFAEDNRSSVRVRMKWQSALAERVILALEVRPEPRLKLARPPRAEITRVLDADGRALDCTALPQYPEGTGISADVLAFHAGELQFGGLMQLKSFAWKGPTRPLKEVQGRVRLEVSARAPLLELPKVLEAAGKAPVSFEGLSMTMIKAERIDRQVHLRVRFEGVESLTPPHEPPQAVRIRPGVIGIRGPMDVALSRLELRGPLGRLCPQIDAWYDRAGDGKGYLGVFAFEPPPEAGEDLTLVLTKAPRTVTVELPFVVRDVAAPKIAKD